MILALSHIRKSFLDETVIKDATFHIEDRERAALVGNNGAGKTTLFRIIAGQLSADSGEVFLAKGKSFGYLEQHTDLSSEVSVFEEVLSVRSRVFEIEEKMRELERRMAPAEGEELEKLLNVHARLSQEFDDENGYAVKNEVTGILKGMGFSEKEFDLPVTALSGGEKTRVNLCKLLLKKPDLLLLDEPTNHLDIHVTAWLETYLQSYPGAVFLISHDRYFLDKLVHEVIDLDRGTAYSYRGNYTDFTVKKSAVWKAKLKEYENQQQMIRHQEEVIEKLRSYNREKSIRRAESREKLLDKVERIEKPVEENDSMELRLIPAVTSGNDVMKVEDLAKSFGQKKLFSDVNFEIRRGERVMIIGDNGSGKTTLLKIITGDETADRGSIELGTKVFMGYYDQEHQVLSPEKSVFSEIQDTYPSMNNTEIRNMLAAFLFTEDDVFKLVADLSGGEKGRVSLAKLMLSNANLLILDEPTNHLDMTSKEILENALCAYEGTLLCVSHDRYFINETATRILELYNGRFINYIGNYDYYLEKRDAMHALYDEKEAGQSASPQKTKANEDWLRQKEEQAKKRKAESELKKVEEAIERTEKLIAGIDEEFGKPENGSNAALLTELTKKRAALSDELASYYEKWEEMI